MPDDRSIHDEIAQHKKSAENRARALIDEGNKKAFLAAKNEADELRKAAMADEIESIRKDAIVSHDKEGNPITKKAIFEDKHKAVMGADQTSIHDWKSSMMALLSVLTVFVAMINQEVNEKTAPYLVPLKHTLKNAIVDIKDTLLNTLRGNVRVDLPTLVHDIKIGDDNKLALKLHANSQDLTDDRVLPNSVRSLVTLWLWERGYELDPNNNHEGYRAKEGHEPLTAEKFNELKNDPENGLNEFLNRASELQYREELDADSPTPP
ncbi:MAG: hypothetical protein LEGION0403_FIIPPAGN_01158 [Legionella sp.]|uniref:hypothetical protein n=1 Tax=Legionella sp. TaxID=459 RepID=UPI003D0EAD39